MSDLNKFIDEILYEAAAAKSIVHDIETSVIIFYEHALKYKHHKEYQTTSWIHTMYRTRDEIRELYKDSHKAKKSQIDSKLTSMYELYQKAMVRAIKDNPTCYNKEDVFEEFRTIDLIITDGNLEKFLTHNAYTYEAKRELNK